MDVLDDMGVSKFSANVFLFFKVNCSIKTFMMLQMNAVFLTLLFIKES